MAAISAGVVVVLGQSCFKHVDVLHTEEDYTRLFYFIFFFLKGGLIQRPSDYGRLFLFFRSVWSGEGPDS